jgi:hypothetical protein
MYKSVTIKCRLCYIDCLGFKWWWSTINQTPPHHQQSPLTTPLPSHIFINLLWQGKLNWTLTWACLAYMVKNIYWPIGRKASKYHRSGQERFKCKKLRRQTPSDGKSSHDLLAKWAKNSNDGHVFARSGQNVKTMLRISKTSVLQSLL